MTPRDGWFRFTDTGIPATDRKSFEILESVIGQLSDGIWENSPSMGKYWKNLHIDTRDGNIIINETYNSPFRWDDQKKVLEFFANKVKQIIKTEIKDGYTRDSKKMEWKRDCDAVSEYMGYNEEITVKDCYRVYDKLKGRKDRISESKKLSESAAIDMSTDDIIKKAANDIATLYNKLDSLNNELDKNFHNAGWRRNADIDSAMKLSDLLVELTYNVLPKYSAKLTDMANEGYHRG